MHNARCTMHSAESALSNAFPPRGFNSQRPLWSGIVHCAMCIVHFTHLHKATPGA
jgi:hypothetical protein